MVRSLRPRIVYSKLQRTRQILNILVKYGFGTFLDQLRVWEHASITRRILYRQREQFPRKAVPERLRLALQELGPLYVKLGQILSTRPDIIPHNFIVELEKLQNQVAPVPTDTAKSVVENELGKSISDGVPYSTFTLRLVSSCPPRKSQFVRMVPSCVILCRSFR